MDVSLWTVEFFSSPWKPTPPHPPFRVTYCINKHLKLAFMPKSSLNQRLRVMWSSFQMFNHAWIWKDGIFKISALGKGISSFKKSARGQELLLEGASYKNLPN